MEVASIPYPLQYGKPFKQMSFASFCREHMVFAYVIAILCAVCRVYILK